MHVANPWVSVCTRQWLQDLTQQQPIVLDLPSLQLLHPVLRQHRDQHPGGFIYQLAKQLEVSHIDAIDVASAVELFYATCSLSDDLQDNEADTYLPYHKALQLNVQGHLLSLIAVRLAQLESRCMGALQHVADAYKTLAIMITGQRMELVRTPWTIHTYMTVARLSAGEQIGFYCNLVGWIAHLSLQEREHFRQWGRIYGMLLQVAYDRQSKDKRLISLPLRETQLMIQQIMHEGLLIMDTLPEALHDVAHRVMCAVCERAVG